MATIWISKLGVSYDKAWIEAHDASMQTRLKKLRNLGENKICADCGENGTVWCIVNLGVFVCFRCASAHRSLGTHISVPKGATGTYLWGPDEMERMERIGNAQAKILYGPSIISRNASDDQLRHFLLEKYRDWSACQSAHTLKRQASPPVITQQSLDLLTGENLASSEHNKACVPPPSSSSDDFFAQFGV